MSYWNLILSKDRMVFFLVSTLILNKLDTFK